MKKISNIEFLKHQPVSRNVKVRRPHMKNTLLKVRTLHAHEPSMNELKQDAKGVVNTKVQQSVSHAPSLYHWLSSRCGIPMLESAQLVDQKRLFLDGNVVESDSVLKDQMMWDEMKSLDLRVMPGAMKTKDLSEAQRKKIVPVPVLQRARHRTYNLCHMNTSTTFTSESSDPRSYIHRAGFPVESCVNLIHAPTHYPGMQGVLVTTDDCLMGWRWQSPHLGNFGHSVYHLHPGVPPEVVKQLLGRVEEYMTRFPISADIRMPGVDYSAKVSRRTWTPGPREHQRETPRQPYDYDAIEVTTHMMTKRNHRFLKRQCSHVTAERCGPFSLPTDLRVGHSRPLLLEELQALYEFDRKLKTNQVVHSLREVSGEFDADLLVEQEAEDEQ